jgi:hypothetical protein
LAYHAFSWSHRKKIWSFYDSYKRLIGIYNRLQTKCSTSHKCYKTKTFIFSLENDNWFYFEGSLELLPPKLKLTELENLTGLESTGLDSWGFDPKPPKVLEPNENVGLFPFEAGLFIPKLGNVPFVDDDVSEVEPKGLVIENAFGFEPVVEPVPEKLDFALIPEPKPFELNPEKVLELEPNVGNGTEFVLLSIVVLRSLFPTLEKENGVEDAVLPREGTLISKGPPEKLTAVLDPLEFELSKGFDPNPVEPEDSKVFTPNPPKELVGFASVGFKVVLVEVDGTSDVWEVVELSVVFVDSPKTGVLDEGRLNLNVLGVSAGLALNPPKVKPGSVGFAKPEPALKDEEKLRVPLGAEALSLFSILLPNVVDVELEAVVSVGLGSCGLTPNPGEKEGIDVVLNLKPPLSLCGVGSSLTPKMFVDEDLVMSGVDPGPLKSKLVGGLGADTLSIGLFWAGRLKVNVGKFSTFACPCFGADGAKSKLESEGLLNTFAVLSWLLPVEEDPTNGIDETGTVAETEGTGAAGVLADVVTSEVGFAGSWVVGLVIVVGNENAAGVAKIEALGFSGTEGVGFGRAGTLKTDPFSVVVVRDSPIIIGGFKEISIFFSPSFAFSFSTPFDSESLNLTFSLPSFSGSTCLSSFVDPTFPLSLSFAADLTLSITISGNSSSSCQLSLAFLPDLFTLVCLFPFVNSLTWPPDTIPRGVPPKALLLCFFFKGLAWGVERSMIAVADGKESFEANFIRPFGVDSFGWIGELTESE